MGMSCNSPRARRDSASGLIKSDFTPLWWRKNGKHEEWLQPHTWDTDRPPAEGIGPYFRAQTARISELLLGWNSFQWNVDVKELQWSKQNEKDPANFACFPCSKWHKPNSSTQLWASSSAALCVEVRLGSVPERWPELVLKSQDCIHTPSFNNYIR